MNLVIVFAVSIFLFLLLLNELSESDGFDLGGVPGKILQKHMGSSFPNGFYTCYSKDAVLYAGWAAAIFTFAFSWIAVNVPSTFEFAIPYTIFGIVAMLIGLVEVLSPKKTFVAAFSVGSGYNISISSLVVQGLVLSAVFVPLNIVMGFGFQVEQLHVMKSSIFMFLISAIMIPFIEESVWGATVGASFLEKWGVLLGSAGILFSWILFHWYTFQPMTIQDIVLLSSFRVSALIPLIKYKSTLPGVMGHMSINASSVLVSLLA